MPHPIALRFWLPWTLALAGWALMAGVLHLWVGHMIVNPSDRVAFGMIAACLGTLLGYSLALGVVKACVPRPWLKTALGRGALLAFFLGWCAPVWFFQYSDRWQLYVLVESARTRVALAERSVGRSVPLSLEIDRMVATPRLAWSNRAELQQVAQANSSQAVLSAFAQARQVGRGPPVEAEQVLANGLARPRDLERLRALGEELAGSENHYDQALVHLIQHADSAASPP